MDAVATCFWIDVTFPHLAKLASSTFTTITIRRDQYRNRLPLLASLEQYKTGNMSLQAAGARTPPVEKIVDTLGVDDRAIPFSRCVTPPLSTSAASFVSRVREAHTDRTSDLDVCVELINH